MMMWYFIFIILLCHNIEHSSCLESCGCVELPGNISDYKSEGSTIKLVPQLGPTIGTLVPKSPDMVPRSQGNNEVVDSQAYSGAKPEISLHNIHPRKIKDLTEPSESECISDCRQLDSHWYSLQSGVCICGHADSIILCEEEIGPVVQVFCIQPEKAEVRTPSLDSTLHWYPTATSVRSSDASENIESGDESTERTIDHHLHELLTAWQPSLHSEINNLTDHLQHWSKSFSFENTTEVHYVGNKDGNKSNKILALILGISALVCLFLAGVRVFLQMRKIRAKEKKNKAMQESLVYPTRIVTRL